MPTFNSIGKRKKFFPLFGQLLNIVPGTRIVGQLNHPETAKNGFLTTVPYLFIKLNAAPQCLAGCFNLTIPDPLYCVVKSKNLSAGEAFVNNFVQQASFKAEYRSGSILGFYDQKFEKMYRKKIFFLYSLDQNLQFTYPQASIRAFQATGEAFSLQKRTFSTSKHEISLLFTIFVVNFYQGCGSGSGIRIGSVFNRVCGSGSGSVFGIRIRIQEGKNDPQK